MLRPDPDESLRYLGVPEPPEDLRRRAGAAGEALAGLVQPRYTYRICGLERREEGFLLAGTGVLLTGSTAARMLADCRQAALLACTLGARFDLKLLALQARDMAEAALWDACGSALAEAGCEAAEAELAARFPELFLTDRFSPGYGDLRRAGRRAEAGRPRFGESSDEPRQNRHGGDWSVGPASGGPNPGLCVLPNAGDLSIEKGRNTLWNRELRPAPRGRTGKAA